MDWQDVWEKRSESVEGNHSRLDYALLLNGYDSQTSGSLSVDSCRNLIRDWAKQVHCFHGDSVYEVGCGAGAFLHMISLELGVTRLAGCDPSSDLVQAGRKLFPEISLEHYDAVTFPEIPTVDHCVSYGVFMYFPSLEYVETTLSRISSKALRSMAIFDLPDLTTRQECEDFRRSRYPDKVYESMFKDLEHLYLDRAWVAEKLSGLGWSVSVEGQAIDGYLNSKFRFNVFATRAN